MVKVRQAPCFKLPSVGKLGLNPRNVVGECSLEIPGMWGGGEVPQGQELK